MESLAANCIKMIESELPFIKLLKRTSDVIQGDDPEWNKDSILFDDMDDDVVNCREAIQMLVNYNALYVSKMQKIRDRIMFIYSKKNEFLKLLKMKFANDE
jgi:hypothetical protein